MENISEECHLVRICKRSSVVIFIADFLEARNNKYSRWSIIGCALTRAQRRICFSCLAVSGAYSISFVSSASMSLLIDEVEPDTSMTSSSSTSVLLTLLLSPLFCCVVPRSDSRSITMGAGSVGMSSCPPIP